MNSVLTPESEKPSPKNPVRSQSETIHTTVILAPESCAILACRLSLLVGSALSHALEQRLSADKIFPLPFMDDVLEPPASTLQPPDTLVEPIGDEEAMVWVLSRTQGEPVSGRQGVCESYPTPRQIDRRGNRALSRVSKACKTLLYCTLCCICSKTAHATLLHITCPCSRR